MISQVWLTSPIVRSPITKRDLTMKSPRSQFIWYHVPSCFANLAFGQNLRGSAWLAPSRPRPLAPTSRRRRGRLPLSAASAQARRHPQGGTPAVAAGNGDRTGEGAVRVRAERVFARSETEPEDDTFSRPEPEQVMKLSAQACGSGGRFQWLHGGGCDVYLECSWVRQNFKAYAASRRQALPTLCPSSQLTLRTHFAGHSSTRCGPRADAFATSQRATRDRRRRRLVSAAIGMTSCRRAAGRPRG